MAPCSDTELEIRAVEAFFHDYCLDPENRQFSRGFLAGLKTLISQAKPDSTVLQATKVVGFANLGTRLGLPHLVEKARVMYSEMLRSFQLMIAHASKLNTAELLMTAVLLGFCRQIITATEDHPSNHSSHSSGIYAILATECSPLGLLRMSCEFQISNPLHISIPQRVPGILHTAALSPSVRSLDALLIDSFPLLRTAESMFSSPSTLVEGLHKLLHDTRAMNEGFAKWETSQPPEWRPRTICHRNSMPKRNLSWVSGRVDEYLDLYVAAVWNAYRKNRLFILNNIVRCLKRLEHGRSYHEEMLQVDELISDQLAAIPFHLTANVRSFAQQLNDNQDPIIVRGRSIGGLLIMHPLYVTSHLSVVNPRIQAQVKDCLAWIGTNMGIGEAKMLSIAQQTFPNKSVANGYTLIWAGMLFTDSDED
ncbi:hypothetical protein V1509DRAFT_515848 [Lipomyces kononenkoae]